MYDSFIRYLSPAYADAPCPRFFPKVKDGRHLYYFANSSNDRVETWVRLRGKHSLQRWDPHTGSTTPADCSHEMVKGQEVTRVRLVLEPVKSVFLIGPVRLVETAADCGPCRQEN